MASIVHRRVAASSRFRENHAAVIGPSSSGRNTKTNPSDNATEEASTRTDTNVLRRKKNSIHSVASSSSQAGSVRSQRPLPTHPEATSEHSRRSIWHRPISRCSDIEVQAMLEPRVSRKQGKSKRRDRSPSRDAPNRAPVRAVGEEGTATHRHHRGSTPGEDYHKIKEELEAIKKVLRSQSFCHYV